MNLDRELEEQLQNLKYQNMILTRMQDKTMGFKGNETIEDFEKHLDGWDGELEPKTPVKGAMLGLFLMFFVVPATIETPLFFISIIVFLALTAYVSIGVSRNEKIKAKEERLTWIKTRIDQIKDFEGK